MPAVREGRVTVDGVSLHYFHAGTAGDDESIGQTPTHPTVLLLHGGIIDAASLSWGDIVEPFGEPFEVYAVDLPGYGESERPDAPYTTAYHIAMLEEFIDELALAPVSIVGLSLGGGIGLGLTLNTSVVNRLVLVDSYGLGKELPHGYLSYVVGQIPPLNQLSLALLRRSKTLTRASLGNIVVNPNAVPDEAVDELYRLLQYPDAGRAFRRWRLHEVTRHGYRTCYRDRYTEVTVPTLLIHGAEDDIFPLEWSQRAADGIPDATLSVFDDCAHWPPRERPAHFRREVRTFLTA